MTTATQTFLMVEAVVHFVTAKEAQAPNAPVTPPPLFQDSDLTTIINKSLRHHAECGGDPFQTIIHLNGPPKPLPAQRRFNQGPPTEARYALTFTPAATNEQYDEELFFEQVFRFVVQRWHHFRTPDLPIWPADTQRPITHAPSGEFYAPRTQLFMPACNTLPEVVEGILYGLTPTFMGFDQRTTFAIMEQLFIALRPQFQRKTTPGTPPFHPTSPQAFREHVGIRATHYRLNRTQKTPAYYICTSSHKIFLQLSTMLTYHDDANDDLHLFGCPIAIQDFPNTRTPTRNATLPADTRHGFLWSDLRRLESNFQNLILYTADFLIPLQRHQWHHLLKIRNVMTFAPVFRLDDPDPVAYKLGFRPTAEISQLAHLRRLHERIPPSLRRPEPTWPIQPAPPTKTSSRPPPNDRQRILNFWTPANDTIWEPPASSTTPAQASTTPPPNLMTPPTKETVQLPNATTTPPKDTRTKPLITPDPRFTPDPPSKRCRARLKAFRSSLQRAAAATTSPNPFAPLDSDNDDDDPLDADNQNMDLDLPVVTNSAKDNNEIPLPPDDSSQTTFGSTPHHDLPIDDTHDDTTETNDNTQDTSMTELRDDTISDPDDETYSSQLTTLTSQDTHDTETSTNSFLVPDLGLRPLPLPAALRLTETFPPREQAILARLFQSVPPQHQATFVALAQTHPGPPVLAQVVTAWASQESPHSTQDE